MSTTYEPDVKTKRAILEQKIAEFKAAGYSHWLEARAVEVQIFGNDAKGLKVQVEQHDHMSQNAYAAAKRMQELLETLPEETDNQPE